jgi:hypothetical protein
MTLTFAIHSLSQEVINSSLSSCSNKSYPEYIRDRLIHKKVKEDTLFLKVGLVLNCCLTPNVELSLRNDTLFLKVTNASDISCTCDCCFELNVNAIGVPDTNFTLIHQFETLDISKEGFENRIESRELRRFKSKYILPRLEEINSITELNQVDSIGRKLGGWEILYENSEKVKYRFKHYIDENGESRAEWSVRYDKEGNIQEVCGIKGSDELRCADKYSYDRFFNYKQKK